jgi:general secretion pathway protein G
MNVRTRTDILSFLAAIGLFTISLMFWVPKYPHPPEAKGIAAKTQIATFCSALDAFEVDLGCYPTQTEGFHALLQCPKSVDHPEKWRGPYIKNDRPKDPWGHPYIYEYPGRHNTDSFDILSLGRDGKRDTGDDISNWNWNENVY